jgi:hypothetical protein
VRSATLAIDELIATVCIGKDATHIAPLMRFVPPAKKPAPTSR